MVEISMFGSGEGLVWATGRGYSTGIIERGKYAFNMEKVVNGHHFRGLISSIIPEYAFKGDIPRIKVTATMAGWTE